LPGPDLTLLIDAALDAGRIAERHWSRDPQIWDKPGGHGPVTEADLEIDAMLRESLTAARPGYGWLSEETEDGVDRLSRDHVFIVDPIDGTRSFIDGQKNFAHSLAVTRQGHVTAAVVYLPMLDRMFTAELGKGAALNGAPLAASGTHDEPSATVLASRPNFQPDHWPGGVPTVHRSFRPSLAYRLALVGQGRFDGMITFRDSWEWDIAAGALIVSEAGGLISDRDNRPLAFNNPRPLLPGVIAANRPIHAALMARRSQT
jgi:myo-inositol-1(or 4)-monophosphatase